MLPVRYKYANLECRMYKETLYLGDSYKTPIDEYPYYGFKIEYNKNLKHNSIAAFGRNVKQSMSIPYYYIIQIKLCIKNLLLI